LRTSVSKLASEIIVVLMLAPWVVAAVLSFRA